jgi:hypothetical protein
MCIDRWQQARGLAQLDWKGTWVGKMPEAPGVTPHNFIVRMQRHAAHERPPHDHHLHELLRVAKLIGDCGIFTEFYSEWMMP